MFNVLFLIPVVAYIGSIIKKAGVDEKFIPLFNLLIGIILGIITEKDDVKNGFITGLYLGLSASGFSKCYLNVFKDNFDSNDDDDD